MLLKPLLDDELNMKYIKHIILILTLALTPGVALAKLNLDQQKVRQLMLKMSDKELIVVRAHNNTYHHNCKAHSKRYYMDLFGEVIAKVYFIDRDLGNYTNQFKYGFHKG